MIVTQLLASCIEASIIIIIGNCGQLLTVLNPVTIVLTDPIVSIDSPDPIGVVC